MDFVSAAIVRGLRRPDSWGQTYHLVPTPPTDSLDFNAFFATIRDLGYGVDRVPYSQWIQRLLEDDRLVSNPLCPLVPMLSERVYRDEATRWEVQEKMPVYTADNTSRLLRGSGITVPTMDRALIAKYLHYWVRSGYLDPPSAECLAGQG